MRQRTPNTYKHDQELIKQQLWPDYVLQAILWSVWTLTVVAVAFVSWHADVVAQRALNIVGMSIHCAVAGIIGLIMITLIEMRLRPWWFLDERQ